MQYRSYAEPPNNFTSKSYLNLNVVKTRMEVDGSPTGTFLFFEEKSMDRTFLKPILLNEER